MLCVLTLFNVLNFVDRNLIASLGPLLMADLGLTRAQIGLLAGFMFVVLYTLVGMVLGVASDRWSRRVIIAAGVGLWSVMTGMSGLARSFAGLVGPRIGLGVGQATLTPAALSMIGDVFPARRLGMASSIYYAGLPIGAALSLLVAGLVAPAFGWRTCFVVLGVTGVVSAGLIGVVGDPRSGTATRPGATPRPSFGTIIAALGGALRGRPALGCVMLGGAMLTYASAAALQGVIWLVQDRGFTYAHAAFFSGALAAGGGFAGNLFGGWFSDWCRKRWAGGRAWSLVILTVGFAPFSVAYYTLPPASPAFYVCGFLLLASTVAFFGPVFALVQELVPPQVRASAVAFTLLVMNLLGVGAGAWLTGVIGDRPNMLPDLPAFAGLPGPHSNLTLGLLVSVGVTLAGTVPFVAAARLTRADRAPRAPSA
jgi:MFS transporter, Spinster family, sphingosine-1-phosphate transporter